MPSSMHRMRSILNPNRNCRSNCKFFNRIDLQLKTFIGFLQYTLHSGIDLRFIPNSCFSGGENGAHFAQTLADVGKMWGNFGKEKIAKPLIFKGLAITIKLNSYPEPGSNRHGSPHWCLRPARLPIPPPRHFKEQRRDIPLP